ncbi:ABC transporter ATP-binding protein [Pseudomonas sp. KNUC1026]|uniref:ABC transporter ATP-binding protein n=1 Tax=Pseudomonas sp. KNUC1026 TaxID=2893890 RepID=UPI001F18DF7B|nr:ABC transporter ATP-binding protein [Pseudomonas sp. KNUC1026]UFH49079.1 ABC transporter ATP-binding protein [Pseudomonas sp. KNUC1026]
MIHLLNVRKQRGQGAQRYTLEVPAWHIAPGERWALVGPSGSGKSSVLDLLALVAAPSEAERFSWRMAGVEHDVARLWQQGRQERLAGLRGEHLGYVLQTGGLLGYLSVRGNIALSRELLGLADGGEVERLAERLDITGLLRQRPSQLSVGQRQRVSCARALAHGPALVLADEPTAALDPLNAERVMSLLLEQVREQQAGLVIASHDEPAMRAAGLRIARLNLQRDTDGGVTARLEAA